MMMQKSKLTYISIALGISTLLGVHTGIGSTRQMQQTISKLKELEAPSAVKPIIKKQEKPPKEVWVNIFVHGIISIKPHLNIENLIRFLHDDIVNTHYEKTVLLMRDDPFFFQNQPMQQLGLHQISLCPLQHGAGASLLAYTMDTIEQITQPEDPTENYYYTFGWSGLMSHEVRYNEAINFLHSLIQLRNDFRAQGIEPHFRLHAYSHGGLLVLVLALARQQEKVDKSFRIAETLFFGMPVHAFTAHCVNDPIFEKIYNISSPGDRIQKLDIFAIGEFGSSRLFKAPFIEPDNKKLIQVEIRFIRRAGDTKPYLQEPPYDFQYTGPHKSYLVRDISPGHTELWFFGWTPLHYRKSFPLYPIPVVAITPYIINTLRTFHHNHPAVPVQMNIYPANSITYIKNANEKEWCMVPFISAKKMYRLRKHLEQYAPAAFTNDLYNYHIQIAYDEAHLFHRQRKIDARKNNHCDLCPDGDDDW